MYHHDDQIISMAKILVEDAGSTDPNVLAEYLGIHIKDVEFKSQKGVYKIISGVPFIFIKSDLSVVMRKIVLLHEIGHDRLHRDYADFFTESDLFTKQNSRMEYEANLFAAEISINTEELLENIYEGLGIQSIAQSLYTDPNLIAIKVSILHKQGYNFNIPETRNDFLK